VIHYHYSFRRYRIYGAEKPSLNKIIVRCDPIKIFQRNMSGILRHLLTSIDNSSWMFRRKMAAWTLKSHGNWFCSPFTLMRTSYWDRSDCGSILLFMFCVVVIHWLCRASKTHNSIMWTSEPLTRGRDIEGSCRHSIFRSITSCVWCILLLLLNRVLIRTLTEEVS
jgi:hypothetical protein